MVELVYKKMEERYRVTYHEPLNDIGLMENIKDRKTNASRMDGYHTNNLNYFTVSNYSEDKEVFIEEYANQLCDLDNIRKTVVVEKEGDKVRLSFYYYHKFRKVGKKFFTKEYERVYLTYNLKTNNFYITKVIKGIGNRRNRRIRCNTMYGVTTISNHIHDFKFTNDDSQFLKTYMSTLDSETQYGKDRYLTFEESFIRFFIGKNEIKGPNHLTSLMIKLYPGKKALKKNGNNIIPAILDRIGLKSKFFINLMNNYKPDLTYVVMYANLLGLKHIKNLNKDFFKYERLPYETFLDVRVKYDNVIDSDYDIITDYDRKNIVKIINDFTLSESIDKNTIGQRNQAGNITGLIQDHIRIIRKLKEYEPDIKIRAKTFIEFENEHTNYSEKYSLYRNSEEIYYLYDSELINELKNSQNGCDYVLLSNDMDYINESTHQSNCVRTYIDKFDSIIISVRRGNKRATTEFTFNGLCIQQRGSYNSPTDVDLIDDVERLETIVKNLYLRGDLKPPQIKIKNKINGEETISTVKELKDKDFRRSRGNEGFLDFLDEELDLMLI